MGEVYRRPITRRSYEPIRAMEKKLPWREGDSIYSFVQILSDFYFDNFKILINSYNNDDNDKK